MLGEDLKRDGSTKVNGKVKTLKSHKVSMMAGFIHFLEMNRGPFEGWTNSAK